LCKPVIRSTYKDNQPIHIICFVLKMTTYSYHSHKKWVIDDIMQILYKNRDKLTTINQADSINIAIDSTYDPGCEDENEKEKESEREIIGFTKNKLQIGYGSYYFKASDENQIEIHYTHHETPLAVPCEGEIAYFKQLQIIADTYEKFHDFYVKYTCGKKKKDTSKLNIYIPNKYGEWILYSSIPKRSIDSIYIDEKIKDKLISDINQFISSEDEYEQWGIPYKRTYMLAGIPGSGKTSIIKAICNKIGYSMNMLSLQKEFDNNSLMTAFKELSKKSVLLIEDIDCIFEQRKTTSENPMISFSSLINMLDGVLYKHGIIIFITTNHQEKLDSALMRLGRMDMILQMNYPREQDIQKLFYDINQKHGTADQIAKMYTKFYEKIKGKNMSMAGIVNFLFQHRMKCLENINDLLEPSEFLNRLNGDDKKNILYS